MGSMNFGLFGAVDRIKEFKHDWEPTYLEASRDFIFRNTYKDIEQITSQLGANGTRFEFECYDVGHLYNLAHFLERGIVEPPLFVQTIFGILGGIGHETEDLLHMRRTADRLFGDDYQWSILGAGRHQTNLVTMGAIMGGNVRVGLEDSHLPGEGQAGRVERRAGGQDRAHPEGAVARGRDARRGPLAAGAEGPREHRHRRLTRGRGRQPPMAAVTTNGRAAIAPTPAITRTRAPVRSTSSAMRWEECWRGRSRTRRDGEVVSCTSGGARHPRA